MSQPGKASIKRGTPSYFMSILGVSLVLIILGVLGWVFLNLKKASTVLRENVQVHAWLNSTRHADVDSVVSFLKAKPYLREVTHIDKEKAKEIYNKTEDPNWDKILIENPLPESIDFYAESQYVNKDSLERLTTELTTTFPTIVGSVQYPKEIVSSMDSTARKIGIIILAVGILLSIAVIFLIDNTIKLAMFSNRFTIKTMQMVGATRSFIAKPMNTKAITNGLVSSLIAIVVVTILIYMAELFQPELKTIRDFKMTALLYLCITALGIGISWFSTNRSVTKYLKMKLDDLY